MFFRNHISLLSPISIKFIYKSFIQPSTNKIILQEPLVFYQKLWSSISLFKSKKTFKYSKNFACKKLFVLRGIWRWNPLFLSSGYLKTYVFNSGIKTITFEAYFWLSNTNCREFYRTRWRFIKNGSCMQIWKFLNANMKNVACKNEMLHANMKMLHANMKMLNFAPKGQPYPPYIHHFDIYKTHLVLFCLFVPSSTNLLLLSRRVHVINGEIKSRLLVRWYDWSIWFAIGARR